MSQEVIEIMQKMDPFQLESRLAMQCAPLFVGLRTSSMFVISRNQIKPLYDLLRNSVICCRVLFLESKQLTVMLYRKDMLEPYICRGKAKEFFKKQGYTEFDMEHILITFTRRYRNYRTGNCSFPHELGLLLGYPMEDVEGFIANQGENSLYTGYWKVYYHVSAKRDLFHMYEKAKEQMILLMGQGIGMSEIIDRYCRKVI